MVLEQHLVGAGRPAVNRVIGAHHRLHVALDHRGAEGGQVGLFQIARAGVHVEAVAHGLRPAVHGKVLAGGHRAQVVQVSALHAADKGHAHLGGQERVFAVGLLAAAPARIAKDVDVRRPEGQPEKDAVVALPLRLVVLARAPRWRSRCPCRGPWPGPRWRPCRWPAERRWQYPARATPCSASFQVW